MPAVLYLDRYHLGDPLFLNGFARDVLNAPEPLVIVHGSGEAAERALEAQGRFPTWKDGILDVDADADRALVELAARELNRQIAHTLNEAGVASVRLDASSRGLLKVTESGLEAKKIDWLRTLVAQRAVPVVAALMDADGAPAREVNGGEVAGRIAAAWPGAPGPARVLVIAKKRLEGSELAIVDDRTVVLDEHSEGLLPEPEAVLAALESGAEVRVVDRGMLRSGAFGEGVRVTGVDNKSA